MSHHLWQSFLYYLWSYWIHHQQCVSADFILDGKLISNGLQIHADSLIPSPGFCHVISPFMCSAFSMSPDDSMAIQEDQTSLDDILDHPSLMTRGQVQVHNQHCLTTHNGETAVSVVAKVLATTGTRVGSKHVPKISLEWGDNKTMRPDFY